MGLACFGLLCAAVCSSGLFGPAQGSFVLLVSLLVSFGLRWVSLGVLGCSGVLWAALGCSGLLWAAQGCSGLLWIALGCSGLLWAALCLADVKILREVEFC